MSPDFLPGDFIIVWRHPWQRFHVGDDVVVNHALYGVMVKRIQAVHDGQCYTLTGLHPDSISSAAIGRQPAKCVVGKVFYHVRQAPRSW